MLAVVTSVICQYLDSNSVSIAWNHDSIEMPFSYSAINMVLVRLSFQTLCQAIHMPDVQDGSASNICKNILLRGSHVSTPDSISTTKDFVSFLWNGDMNAFRGILAGDFTFVGPFEHNSGTGIAHFVDFRVRLGLLLEHLTYEMENAEIVYGDTHTAVTVANLDMRKDDIHLTTLHCTLVWRVTARGLRLVHLHMSIPMRLQADSYHSQNAELIRAATAPVSDSKPLIIKDSSGKTHLINLAETTYLEAQHQYTMIRTTPEPFRVRESLTSVMGRFPSYFIRVHRSYVVNAFLVESVSKDAISMRNGDIVPIPAKRAASVRKLILDTISEALTSNAAYSDAGSSDASVPAGKDAQGETCV